MKKLIIALAFAAAVPVALAAGAGHEKGARLDRLAEKLELTAEQRTRLEAVLEGQHEKRKAARAQMQEEMRAGMAGVLTPEQMEKMEAMRAQHREKRAERHGKHRRGCGDEGERTS